MASSPEENGVRVLPTVRPRTGEEVVISGISGIFPSSDNTTQFSDNLFNHVDMVTKKDLHFHHPEAPRHLGQISGLNKFDAQFFRVTYHHAVDMEPVSRKLLEQAYTAMFDAGINPLSLKGKKVGVFIGTSFSDTSNIAMYHNASSQKGFVLSGYGKSMFSNRISYWIDAKGPSYSLDCSCASTMVCLEHAYQAMTNGECEAAIVGGGNICKLPQLGLNLRKAGMACLDGKTKCFDKNGDGSVRAEAINCIFLQKAKDARRIYAEVYYAQVMYGLREDAHFLPLRKSGDIAQFLKNFYSNIDVSALEVEYVEADGSAIVEADENELKAIGDVFAKGTHKPVYVGCVKSNMGHAEPASGVCAITKMCLAYHKGKIPANLHYTEPLNTPELKTGKIQVLQKNESFNRGYTAVNQFSYNGTNCHVLLKGHYKPKDTSKYKTSIPRLVLVSGRQDENVKKIFNALESQPIDPEILGMLHNIYQIDTPGHTSRGYTIIDTNEHNETVTLTQSAEYYSGVNRPLWLVFSGMGSQWPSMATKLMKIPTFAAAIQKCHNILKPFGVDLIRVVTAPDKAIFEDILNCFIGISAVQIGLTDVLKEIGLVPDHIIGHSQGEICCAYWDCSFTIEETILSAYNRGITASEYPCKGAMAAVGLGYKDIAPLLPSEIDVACRNSNKSSTISGPVDAMKTFVTNLSEKGIFAKEIPNANIAFHSRYIRSAGPKLLEKLKAVIKNPKPRSEKWISTSLPQERWHEDIAKYSSAEYHTNNLISPVYFEEGTQLIQNDAVVVEVAPHGLLQAILKRSHPDCTHISLTKRGHDNPVRFLFEAIGKLYQEGYNFKIDNLYPKIEYPVSTETQMISHFIDWEHSEDWPEIVTDSKDVSTKRNRQLIMSIHDDEYKYISGHIRNGKNVLPESAMLVFVWDTLAKYKGLSHSDISVVMHDVQFHEEAIIEPAEPLRLNVMINKGNDYFELTQENVILANGFIAEVSKVKFDELKEENNKDDKNQKNEFCEDEITLNCDDLYTYLHSRGFTYMNEFQSITSTNFDRTKALINWNGNWIIFLDSLIQLNVLTNEGEGIIVPKIIKKLTISMDKFRNEKSAAVDRKCFEAKWLSVYNVTRCAGIELKQIIFENIPIKQQEPDVLISQLFVPHSITEEVNMKTALQINLQIITDNIFENEIKVTEVSSDPNMSISNIIQNITQYIPNVIVEIQTVELKNVDKCVENSNLIILLTLLSNGKNIDDVLRKISDDTFILTLDLSNLKIGYFDVISSFNVQGKNLLMLRKKSDCYQKNVTYMTINNHENFAWVPTLERELQNTKRLVIVLEKQPYCGFIGLVRALKKKYPKKIGLIIVDDYVASAFDKTKPLYEEQVQKGLVYNVLQKGQWGSYYYLEDQSSINVQNIKLISTVPGDIDNLRWAEEPKIASKNLIQVCFAGPSVKDSQRAVGMTEKNEDGLGFDFSGFDSYGDRVMGLISGGAIASTIEADPELLWQVPNYWSLEDAATVPLPYVLACYCLAIKGQLRKGQSIFVNGGAGAFGQAVISISLYIDCTVFTSVSNDQKKQFLLKLFPKLQRNNISISRNGDFSSMIKINTKGKGCDFVINSASGYMREAATHCTAPCGVFMDVNDLDWRMNKPLGMSYIFSDRTYKAINLFSIFRTENEKERKMLQSIVAEGIKNGFVKPISRVIYHTNEVSRSIKLLTSNKRIGRVLFKMRNAEIPTKCLQIIPRMTYSQHGTYVILCDQTELGIELAHRLVKRGARKIMLHLKSKNVSGYMQLKFTFWMKLGAQIKISTESLDLDKNCTQLFNDATKIGQIHGIFIIQETTTNDDKWRRQDFVNKYEHFSNVVAKLDIISRNNSSELRQFVVISRSSQNAVDEYTTSVLDRICHERKKIGLPAISLKIELLDELQTEHLSDKIRPQNITTFLNALETSIRHNQSSMITYNLNKQRDSEVLEKVLRCLNIENIDNVESRLTVNDMIKNDINLEELKYVLTEAQYNKYTVEKLTKLTVSSLKSLAKKCTKQNNNWNSKLGAFYTFVEKDEYLATVDIIPMETISCQDVETNELNENATHVILIPGFEGHHRIFKPICERLKVRAVTFQLGPHMITESIQEMANSILKAIKRNFVFKSKFYLLGYSFGVNVALEVAALLEREGHVGIVYCLDSSPDVLKVQLDAYIGKKTTSQLQNCIIEHFYQLMTGENNATFSETVEKSDVWSKKVNACVNRLKTKVSYTHEYIRNVLDSAYRKIQLAYNYNPNLRLESELVLMKGIPHPNSDNVASDYCLSKYTKKPVNVISLVLDHAAAPQDCRISNIINKFIDPELFEQ